MTSVIARRLAKRGGMAVQQRSMWGVTDFDASFQGAEPSHVTAYPKTKVTTLSNGMRVATEPFPAQGESATVGVWIDAGSRYETKETNGVAHFLEHLSFKGTNKRSQTQLEKEVEDMGGHLNAYTSREQTVYYAQVMKGDVPQAMNLLSDILLNSKLEQAAVEKERRVILCEMEEVYKTSEELVFDHLHETAFPDCPLGYTILGPEENIKTINRQMILDYINQHYTADRMVIVGAGNIDHEELVDLAEKEFAGVRQATEPTIVEGAQFLGSDYRERWDDMKLAHLAFAFPTCGWADADAVPLMFAQQILGNWEKDMVGGEHQSSNLVQAISGEGIAEKIQPFNTHYRDTGLFGVYTSAPAQGVDDTMHYVTKEMTRLTYEVTERQAREAANKIKTQYLLGLDSSPQVAEEVGRQLLTYGRRVHPAEFMARVDAVTADDVREVAHKYFNDRDHVLACVGPVFDLPDYILLRRKSYWNLA